MSSRVAEKVRAAVLEEGNVLEDIFAGIDPEDVVGFNVFLFTHRALLAQAHRTIKATYGEVGRYSLVGTAIAAPA